MAQIRHLVRLESMVNVGCKFGLNDLSIEEWDGLIVLSMERAWISKKEQGRKNRGEDPSLTPEEQRKRNEARKAMNLPPPGGTIFPQSKPLR